MAVCQGCGIDHEQEILDHAAEYALLYKAEQFVKNLEERDALPHIATTFIKSFVQANQNERLGMAMNVCQGDSEHAIAMWASLTMATGFAMGLRLADRFDYEQISGVTDGEVQEVIDTVREQAAQQRTAEEIKESFVNFLRENMPEGMDVQIVSLDQLEKMGMQPPSASDDAPVRPAGDDTPGGYYL